MNNSQDSDFMFESTDIFCNSPTDPTIMDAVTYESLVSSTKAAFSNIQTEIRKPTFPACFSTLLEDCRARISQSLGLITDILRESDNVNLIGYLNNAVSLLQLLSDLIKNDIIESVSMTCCNMKTFPTTTGHIIFTVFTHCKDSSTLYGDHLNSVENQLKDLFRTCHELQLIYLKVLEKHFIFDFTDTEEQDILIKALDINLEIGDIVQCLDPVTTTKQWYAFSAICEKYSSCLMDKSIYDNCSRILCKIAENKLQLALQPNQDPKIYLKSLKICSFMFKILLKMSRVFKHSVVKDQKHILELLLYIYLHNAAYLEAIAEKSAEFINVFNYYTSNFINPVLAELVVDDNFVNCLLTYDIYSIRTHDKLLGLIMLVMTMIKALLQRNDEHTVKFQKHKLIDCIYAVLPYCHVWFNVGLKFKLGRQHTCGLYERLLTHTIRLVVTMTTDEFNALEMRMVESILSTECYSAKFSSNLWVLLARMSSRQLLLNQVASLCIMYQKLEGNDLFADSPQQIQLACTLSSLFQVMLYEDKIQIYNRYNINDSKNLSLWTVLKISNLPREVQGDAEDIVIDNFKVQFRQMSKENILDIDNMIKILNLASTCKFLKSDEEMETLVTKAWSKACPRNNIRIAEVMNKRTMWYYKYVRGLVMITNSMQHIFINNSENLVKVLHAITEIVHSGSTEIKLLLINILCKLANFQIQDMHNHLSVMLITQTVRELSHYADIVVRNKLFNELRNQATDNLDRIISKVMNADDSLRNTWVHFEQHGSLNTDCTIDVKQHFEAAMDFKYSHKCIDIGDNFGQPQVVDLTKSTSNNFDFANIDTLFDTESVSEPVSKKAKLNADGVVDEIISRLEEDTVALCKVKENIRIPEYQKRIKKICNKLAAILD